MIEFYVPDYYTEICSSNVWMQAHLKIGLMSHVFYPVLFYFINKI